MIDFDLDCIHIGPVGSNPGDGWKTVEDDDPDDELLEKTDPGVVAILGFDPLDWEEDDSAPA